MHEDRPMLTLEEVQALVLERCEALGPVTVDITAAANHVLAEDALAREDVPPFANTAMDGYAVRARDTLGAPVSMRVVGVLPAGSAPPDADLGVGEALQIMTGAPMPPGADAVVVVERTEREESGSTIRVLAEVETGANIRSAGSDFAAGTVALRTGTEIGPAQIAVLSTIGKERVKVWRRPRVGVMSTGDELMGGSTPLLPGQIRESNRRTLCALVAFDGFEPVDLGVVRDNEAAVEKALRAALEDCDAVLSTGGVSMGEFDYVKTELDRLARSQAGGEAFELAVAIRPAKPLALAWIPRPSRAGGPPTPGGAEDKEEAKGVDRSSRSDGSRVVFFGLPGNPVSAMVSYQVIALPGLRKLAGDPEPVARPVRALAAESLPASRDGRLHLVRVEARFRDDGRLEVRSAGGQQSHQLSGTTRANALALVPAGRNVASGDEIEVLLLGRADELGRLSRSGGVAPADPLG